MDRDAPDDLEQLEDRALKRIGPRRPSPMPRPPRPRTQRKDREENSQVAVLVITTAGEYAATYFGSPRVGGAILIITFLGLAVLGIKRRRVARTLWLPLVGMFIAFAVASLAQIPQQLSAAARERIHKDIEALVLQGSSLQGLAVQDTLEGHTHLADKFVQQAGYNHFKWFVRVDSLVRYDDGLGPSYLNEWESGSNGMVEYDTTRAIARVTDAYARELPILRSWSFRFASKP